MKIIKINNLTLYLLIVLLFSGYLPTALIILFIIIIHELGHVFWLKLFKYKIIDITIYPFGGITRVDKKINSCINKDIVIAFGGIFFQLLLNFILQLLPIRLYIKKIFYRYNLSILLFNLLPIIPLDGYIILNCILNKYFSFKKSYFLSVIISIVFIIIYILLNAWYSINNYMIVILFIYKIYEFLINYKYVHNRFLLERFLGNFKYRKISTKEGDLDILKFETLQYFKEGNKIVNERDKIRKTFDIKPIF